MARRLGRPAKEIRCRGAPQSVRLSAEHVSQHQKGQSGRRFLDSTGAKAAADEPARPMVFAETVAALAHVHFGTVSDWPGGYTSSMQREIYQAILVTVWVLIICVAALAAGVTSVPAITGVAVLAVMPALVMRQLWRDPPPTMSEAIRDARK